MIGIVVVSHGNIAKEMVATTLQILPNTKRIIGVDIDSDASKEVNQKKVCEAVKAVKTEEGVIVLTDMFGGTPSNICLPLISKEKLEIISGVNLPMLIKLASLQNEETFENLPKFIKDYGRKNIVIASDVLKGNID